MTGSSDTPPPERTATGAERGRTVLAGLASAGVAALAATREWASATETNAAGIASTTAETGNDLAAWALPCALAAGAAFLAMLAIGPLARRIVGGLATAAGLAAALAGVLHFAKGPAPITLTVAGLVAAAAGAAAVLRSGRWPRSATRYDSKPVDGDAIAEEPTQLWNALDAGQDPSSPTITASAQEKGRP